MPAIYHSAKTFKKAKNSTKKYRMKKTLVRLEDDSSWLKKIYQWTPHVRRRIRKPQELWKSQVIEFIRTRNTYEIVAEDKISLPFEIG